jgi:putative tryptophan/tyrosine transport system substrate-binding protein
MRRRTFIAGLGGIVAWPQASRAQQPHGKRLVGVLVGFAESDHGAQSWVGTFRNALTNLGWAEGTNIQIEVRWAVAGADRTTALAKQLVDLRPDAILGVTTPVTDVLIRETSTIPIVFVAVADPIASGFAASLGRPGGNVTGFALYEPEMGGKWVQLLKEIAPSIQRIALLFNPRTSVPVKIYMPSIEAAASSLAVKVNLTPIAARDEIESIIVAEARNPGSGVLVLPDSFTTANRELIISLTAHYRLPAIYNAVIFAESGGLIAYGGNFSESFRAAAAYIDRLLKGEKTADLPVQAPTKFDLIINLRAAKSIGIDVPIHLQQLATEVIE